MPEIPHDFGRPELLRLALTHASSGTERDNERLEFLGDAALDLVVAEELYRHHEHLAEGDLTELKALVVSRRSLAEAAAALELAGQATIGPGLATRALPRSVLANLYEAVLGAVYLDAGLEAARAFVRTTLGETLSEVEARREASNPKQTLQQLSQKRWGSVPEYVVLESRGEAHARAFLVAAVVDRRPHPGAWGRTRKEAETWAAHEALLVLRDELGNATAPQDVRDAPHATGPDDPGAEDGAR
jgi:ribonuclease-3